MGYFAKHYGKLSFPLAEDGRPGFRSAQIAAAQAVASHFFGSSIPAIVTMPTGAGKTTVLMACAFMLRATRILVLTPSRLVREQIAENFRVLSDLKKIDALPLSLTAPRVFATEHTVGTREEWEALRQYDVVVATVPSVSSRDGVAPDPPADLFDLVLVDEAHHSPASTWARLLAFFSSSKQVLFTATPFRRDDKEIKGKFVFSYDLRRAYDDKVFGDIAFEPVTPRPGIGIDIAIAQAAESRFTRDRAQGLQHLVMVRVDSIARGKELKKVYEENTRLRLAFVSGAHTLKHVKAVVEKLRAAELDGVICVNMFGEGFNLPTLKIAAVHSPHKSLAITLQFIGRFARTGQSGVGQATFLAEPTTSGAGIRELYETGAVWRNIIQNLSAARIDSEISCRDVLDSFVIDAAPDMSDFSLYTVRPYYHAKVFAAPEPIDLDAEPDFPAKHQIIYKGISGASGAVVYLTRQTVRSAWSTDERFTNVSYDLFIFHYNAAAGLLFICASRRDEMLYNRLARTLLNGRPRMLAHSVISRALNDLEAAEFFSIGMRKRHTLGRVESYRMISGPSADKAIMEADGKTFGRGHCFGKATEDGEEITIGVSASSKIWSNTYDQIPELLAWCDKLAGKIASGLSSPTGSRLDLLSSGEELTEVPSGVIAMSWGLPTVRDQPPVFFHNADGAFSEVEILDFDLRIVESKLGEVHFGIKNDAVEWRGIFSISDGDLIEPIDDGQPNLTVHISNEDIPIADYLNSFMPIFYCSDLSSIEGMSRLPAADNIEPFGSDGFEPVDWGTANVDITKEIWNELAPDSIFDWTAARLLASPASVVFCDHGAGEISDFISLEETARGPLVSLYHCKGSDAATPGNRVEDLYEVCGQAVKSSIWLKADLLLLRMKHRARLPSIKGYIKGDAIEAERILNLQSRQQVQFEIYIVQPGVMMTDRREDLSQILGATKHYLVAMGGVESFRVIGSR
jgi:superfamily II DNA or RNA helicase